MKFTTIVLGLVFALNAVAGYQDLPYVEMVPAGQTVEQLKTRYTDEHLGDVVMTLSLIQDSRSYTDAYLTIENKDKAVSYLLGKKIRSLAKLALSKTPGSKVVEIDLIGGSIIQLHELNILQLVDSRDGRAELVNRAIRFDYLGYKRK